MNPEIAGLLNIDPAQLPLQNYHVYSGKNLEVASNLVGSIANQVRRFEVLDGGKNCTMDIYRARLAKSQIGLTYNSHALRITTPKRTKHYTLVVPLSGFCLARTNVTQYDIEPLLATFNSANSEVSSERSANYLALVLILNQEGFEHFANSDQTVLLHPEQPYFLKLNLTEPRYHRFCNILGTLLKVLDEPSVHDSHQDLVISRLEEALWYQFFISCPEISEIHAKNQSVEAVPAPLRKAVEYVEANLAEEIDINDLVRVSGSSTRSLYYGFKDGYGCGPMEFVRRMRLEKCHKQLLESDPGEVSVTDVASVWGFFHLSNFSKNYRELYGELPSETLKKDPS